MGLARAGLFVLDMKTKNKTAEIKTLARRHSKAAVKILAAIMNNEDGPATARVSAAQALLDRGWARRRKFCQARRAACRCWRGSSA